MYKRLLTLLLISVVCLSFAGCKKDDEINSTMADIHTATDEIVKKIDTSPTVEGVDDAQKYWDSKKADLKKKWDGIKGARGFQVSDDTKKKMGESYINDSMAMKNLEIKHMGVTIRDAAFKSKLEKLVKEWDDTFALQ